MEKGYSGSSAPSPVVQVCFPNVRAAVLDSLNRQREEGRLCDLSIQVQGQVFRAHRCVLAAASPYFHDQVLLKNVTTVSLPSVMDPLAFQSVLSSAYTGQLSIVRDDIVNYVTVASFLQMWHIVDKCTEILKRPRPAVELSPGETAPPHGGSSRQQSPSSSDCYYTEREEKGKERGQGRVPSPEKRSYGQEQSALPPLATWRRPQQIPRWSRPRPSPHALSLPPQHLVDSQIDYNIGEECGDYSSCDGTWMSSGSGYKASSLSHEGLGPEYSHTRHNDPSRLRARPRFRGAAASTEKPQSRDRGVRERGEEPQEKRRSDRGIEADEGVGEEVEETIKRTEKMVPSGECPRRVPPREEGGQADERESPNKVQKEVRVEERGSDLAQPDANETERGLISPSCPGPALSARIQWQANPWPQQGGRPLEGEEHYRRENDEDEAEEEEMDFGRFADGAFGGETYDEIEDGTGQVSQRPLVPVSPDDSEFILGHPELSWPPSNLAAQGPGGALTPNANRHLSPSPTQFPPSSSPPIPSSSSPLSLAGAPYTGKVHFCHCGKAYTLKSMRDRHVKMQHLNLRPFACPVCAKTFKMKHHLTKHLKTHGGLRPYECSLCGKKVIWRDSFLRHQTRCQRLAATGMPPPYDDSTANGNNVGADNVDDNYGYSLEEGEGFLSESSQVKVEVADFHGEEEEPSMDGLLGVVSRRGNEMGAQTRPPVGHVLKEEEGERCS